MGLGRQRRFLFTALGDSIDALCAEGEAASQQPEDEEQPLAEGHERARADSVDSIDALCAEAESQAAADAANRDRADSVDSIDALCAEATAGDGPANGAESDSSEVSL